MNWELETDILCVYVKKVHVHFIKLNAAITMLVNLFWSYKIKCYVSFCIFFIFISSSICLHVDSDIVWLRLPFINVDVAAHLLVEAAISG